MRSRHADRFNHDEDAAGYDRDVLNEADPIRAGYDALLDWVAAGAAGATRVLDLGAGTANLSLRLPRSAELVCVDVSQEMEKLARAKLGSRAFEWVRADLLEYFDAPSAPFDAVVSSYAIHHLVEDEKQELFARISRRLAPGGRALFGDLMFENAEARRQMLEAYRASGHAELADEIDTEFFWDVSSAVTGLESCGLRVETRRFSELGWGIAGTAP